MKIYEMTWNDLRSCAYEGSETHSGIRFHNAEKISNPEKADAILIPLSPRETDQLTPQLWVNINEIFARKYNIDERRFVSYDCSDFEFTTDKYKFGCFIRSNLKLWMKQQMPFSIPWSWPVENFKELVPAPEGGFKFKIGFRGWLSSNVRKQSSESCLAEFGPEMDYYGTNEFFGYIERDRPEDAKIRKELFKQSLKNCLLQLTPCSIWNVFPYRFWEAMSAGRVPVLICHDFCLPFEDKVDWTRCTIIIHVQEANRTGQIVRKFLQDHNEQEIIEMGKYGREMWEKWFNRDRYPELMEYAVEEKFKKEGLLR